MKNACVCVCEIKKKCITLFYLVSLNRQLKMRCGDLRLTFGTTLF